MLNYVWISLVFVSLVVGAVNGTLPEVTEAAFNMAKTSVSIAMGLIGVMALWMGILKIAEEGGLHRFLARLLRPVSKRLFPDIPHDHPAIMNMLLNLSANWLGLSNAATPFGLKAMEDLQRLNQNSKTASNAMVVFLALNTAAITFVPVTILAVRSSLNSVSPGAIIGSTIVAGVCATVTGVVAAKLLEKLPVFRRKADVTSESVAEEGK